MKLPFLPCLLILLLSCTTRSTADLQPTVDTYIKIYQDRTDFEGFLQLYAEDMVLEDMVAGWRIEGKESFRAFFNWSDDRFQKRGERTFEVISTTIDENRAVIQGYFTPWSWDGKEIEAMQFTTLLYFNENEKIQKHIDWINYPNDLIDYSERDNSNGWIK